MVFENVTTEQLISELRSRTNVVNWQQLEMLVGVCNDWTEFLDPSN
jgi:hypothetical protein